ncbi:hypothetical protein A2448_02930 [Candidatus Peregrinibacteria bacterium RIFOXYC2_FULL_41_22]|nr:MAG: hypothetical protein A2448_02930 [Candidatus Peregrinibacteria bacterium RIFOXYC2_FULL_41_22]
MQITTKMQKSFDQKWGSLILAGVTLFISCFVAIKYIVPQSWGADEYDDDYSSSGFYGSYYEGMSETIYEENGIDPDVTPNWDNIFGKTGKENGKNLYLLIYNKIKNEPSSEALENTARYFGYTKNRMINIIDGDLYAIYSFDQAASNYTWGENTASDLQSVEGLTTMYDNIINYYEEQLAVQTLNSELGSTAASQEIFANGNTEDSGFDLIVDLWNIEEVLFFGKNEEGLASSMDPWDGGVEEPVSSSASEDSDIGESSDESAETDVADEASSETDTDVDSEDSSSEIEDTTHNTSFECFEDNSLSNELADALGNNDSSSESDTENTNDTAAEGDTSSGETPEEKSETPAVEDSGDSGDDTVIEAPSAADWSNDLPCTETLCLEINFVSESDEPEEAGMEEDSDCIYCHISYIEKMLENITSHDLAGSKVTGNALEDATCKEDSLKIVPNMYVFAIGSPILTPPNDDTIVDVGKLKEDFLSALFPNYETPDSSEYTDSDEILLRLQAAGQTQNIIELSEEASDLAYEQLQAQIEAIESFALSSQMGDMSAMYQAVSSEMEQMNDFFYVMESIITGGDDGFVYYLTTILDKPYK